ncbi:Oligopeptidase A [Candidatus Profftia lariciata]|uniref:oligopeptidase A n=1 Tax=Candidatus Profftia lariciata TaxID=1987921 RepID=UPI001D0244A9|nr:oligopeptidase A [Candidatus Profftia lariciata]UDG81347.1 Oligopeptidase A [Candidatus Profftia lariciata]
MKNTLFTRCILPPFSKIKYKEILPIIQALLEDCYSTIERVVAQSMPFTWNNLCQPLAEKNDDLNRMISIINHLNAIQNNLELRKIYDTYLILISEYNAWVGQHYGLYQAYLNLQKGAMFTTLTKPQQKSVNLALQDFELSGINLPTIKKQRYKKIITRLSELSTIFSNNVLDATMGWSKLITDKNMLAGLPERAILMARILATSKKQDGWLFTLDIPSYLPVITYADNRKLRYEMYRAFTTRASDQGPNAGQWDNSNIINETLQLRQELAKMLHFRSYAHKSLANKMAKDPQQVLKFLNYLVKKLYLQGTQEYMTLRKYTCKNYNIRNLEPWDIKYYSEKQKQYLYSINDEQIRPYFPEHRVLYGLFEIVHRIFNITIKECYNVDVWHPDVRFFKIYGATNELCGSFYLDIYSREHKSNGAWMDTCVDRMRRADGNLQKPVAYLICNFSYPINDSPVLLTHNEVITLFHEFGHCLHHTMTAIEVAKISGINGVPWDAIEFPSQFMENWCWEPEALVLISGHYQNNEPLPKDILNKLIATNNYQKRLHVLHQLELSILDLRLHTEFNSKHIPGILTIIQRVKKCVAVIPSQSWERPLHTFNHIFSGSYAAGYYSYLWAELLSSDAFLRFKEEGIFNSIVGNLFLNKILSQGGSDDPLNLFKQFCGRKPKIDAMLHNYNINN